MRSCVSPAAVIATHKRMNVPPTTPTTERPSYHQAIEEPNGEILCKLQPGSEQQSDEIITPNHAGMASSFAQ